MDGCPVMRRGERRRRRRRRRWALRNLGWLWDGGGWVSVSVYSVVGTGGGLLVVKEVCSLCWFRRILMRLIVCDHIHTMECI